MTPNQPSQQTDSAYAWLRLSLALVLGTVGSAGMWSVPVALPAVQAEFGVLRADASLPFTLAMVGFAGGSVVMGRLSASATSRPDSHKPCGSSRSCMC